MPRKMPSWWSERSGWRPLALAPAAAIYGAAVKARFARATPYQSRIPIICVGNFTMGGAGKTPLAIALFKLLLARGERPAFLTRGYGGRKAGPVWVDAARHTAAEVGDEPLLLARYAPTMVARARPEGARGIEEGHFTVIIMDDGFQNPSLQKDFSIVAVDGGFGLGNERVFPAGPLRAPLAFQMPRADAVVTIGGGRSSSLPDGGILALKASLEPADADWLTGARVFAFCGIGRPEKFFETLRGVAGNVVGAEAFADHHVFQETDASRLLAGARAQNAALVTTEKDLVRLTASAGGALGALRDQARALAVNLTFSGDDEKRLLAALSSRLNRTWRH